MTKLTEQFLDALLSSLNHVNRGVFVLDENGRIFFANQTWFQLNETMPGIGERLADFFAEDAQMFEAWRAYPVSLWEGRLHLTRGSIVHIRLCAHLAKDGAGLVGMVVDAEVQPQTIFELEAAREEMDTFCYFVSHDLRSPLRAIDGFAQILDEDCAFALDDKGRSYIGRIRAAAKRMETMIDGLLSLANVTRHLVARKTVSLTLLAKNIIESLSIQSPVKIEWDIAENLSAEADPNMMEVVLSNLLDNAVKFSARVKQPRIEFSSLPTTPTTFFVRDNGIGFDDAYAHNIFQPFVRLHGDVYPGTGMGLPMVNRAVRRHGGKLWAESRQQGAAFFFTLSPQPQQYQSLQPQLLQR